MNDSSEKENNGSFDSGNSTEENNSDSLKCQKEREEYLDGWKRAKAELINYKKDEAKRFETVVKFANENLARSLVAVLDSFDLALMSLDEESNKIKKGIYLIKAQLEDVLRQNGLEVVITEIGSQYDPMYHEVIAMVDSDKPHGTILEEIEKGYKLNGKLIRPARVRVSK